MREGRRRIGLTQAQMGRLVERSQGEISRIEAGRVEPPIWVIMYLLHNHPDLLSSTTTDVEQLKAAVRQRIETMDEAALRAVLAFSRK